MAYENMTYEFILKRMMDNVTINYPNLDTREGSILFNALAPAAIELAIMYSELNNCLNECFVDTASRDYLYFACDQIGMSTAMFEASNGIHKGEFNVEVTIGSRWNCDIYNYVIESYIGEENGYHYYKMYCETDGVAPNSIVGDLTGIDELPTGLTHAKIVKCLIEGKNETPDDKIRIAYFDYINSTATNGNVNQYVRWCDEYPGIGKSKVIPLWNGANTVKVSILNESNRAASDELISKFQKNLDPNSDGMGDGVAPIGSIVTVSTATEIPINVSATVTLKSSYKDVTPIKDALTKYFSELAYEKTVVPYMTVGSVILNTDCVESINNLKINSGTSDITLGEEEIPILGTTDWVV